MNFTTTLNGNITLWLPPATTNGTWLYPGVNRYLYWISIKDANGKTVTIKEGSNTPSTIATLVSSGVGKPMALLAQYEPTGVVYSVLDQFV